MSNLLMVYERNMPTVSIWDISLTRFSEIRPIKYRKKYITELTPADIDETDVLLMVRPMDSMSLRVARRAREAGCTVVCFMDDDLLELPPVNPTIPWRKKALYKTIQASDIMCSSSEYIFSKYQRLTAENRSARIDTIVLEKEIEEAKAAISRTVPEGPVRIVYAASAGHVALFNRYILPAVPGLAEKYGKSIEFTFISVKPDLSAFEDKLSVNYLKGMPLDEYRRFMLENRFDIGLAPLDDDGFSRCKYFNKYLEYSVRGIVGIYSRVEPYTFIVKDGENGLLSENDPSSWLDKLSRAIEDPQLRDSCRKAAVCQIEERFTAEKIVDKLIEDIPELVSPGRERRKCRSFFPGKLMLYLLRPFEWIYLSLFFLKNTGISGFIKKCRMHFREAGAYSKKRTAKS